MRTLVNIRVPIPTTADAGDAVQMYTDAGSGTVDLAKPMLARPKAIHATGRRSRGLGSGVLGRGPLGQATPPVESNGGLGSGLLGAGALGSSAEFVEAVIAVRPMYGVLKVAARVVDREGNVQGSAPEIAVMVSSSTPPGMRSFAYESMQSGKPRFALDKNLE